MAALAYGDDTPIEVVDSEEAATVAAIARPLVAFNSHFAGPAEFLPLVLALKEAATGAIVGGLAGETVYGWLSIQILFVPERLRGRGIGSSLIRRAEQEARSRGCSGELVNTFSFQARPFYERLGFTLFGTLENCPPGYCCYYLSKSLAPVGTGTRALSGRSQVSRETSINSTF